MGSHTTLAHPDSTRDPVELSTNLARQQGTGQAAIRDLEQTFDRLNPDYGIPADTTNPYGQQSMRDREAALALGTRVAVAISRENDRNPVMWLASQDYRAADATRHARREVIRSRPTPERLGPER